MRITLVSNCGLVLEQDGSALLLDALNKQYRCYYGLPPEAFANMLSAAFSSPTRTPTTTVQAARSGSVQPVTCRYFCRSRTHRSV